MHSSNTVADEYLMLRTRPQASGADDDDRAPITPPIQIQRARRPIAGAAAVSVLIHAALIAAAVFLIRGTRRVPPIENEYIYVTLPGVGKVDGGNMVKSIEDRHANSPIASRTAQRFSDLAHHAARHVARVPRLTPVVHQAAEHAAPRPRPSIIANSGSSTGAGSSFNQANGAAGSAIGSGGAAATGSGSGLIAYRDPVLLSRIVPTYPEDARSRGIEGVVILQFIVDQWGRVARDIEVLDSIPTLDGAAIDAVRQWRFVPGRDRDGNPIKVIVRVPLKFTLE
jgi:periplasmic protein TonB